MASESSRKKAVPELVIGSVGLVLLVWFGVCMIRPHVGQEPGARCSPGLWKQHNCVLGDPGTSRDPCGGHYVGVSADRKGRIEVQLMSGLVRIANDDSEFFVKRGDFAEQLYLLAVSFEQELIVAHSKGLDHREGGAQPRFGDVRVLSSSGAWTPASSPELSQFARWNVSSLRPTRDGGFLCIVMDSLEPTALLWFAADSGKVLPIDNAIDLSGQGDSALLADKLDQSRVFRVVNLESGAETWRFSGASLPRRIRMSFALDQAGERCFVFEPSSKREPNIVTVLLRDGSSVDMPVRVSPDSTSAWFGAWTTTKHGGTISQRFIYTGQPAGGPRDLLGSQS